MLYKVFMFFSKIFFKILEILKKYIYLYIMKNETNIQNKKGLYNFQVIEKYTAGIVLIGGEVKSIKNSSVNFVDSYCIFIDDELWLTGLHVSQYKFGDEYVEKRDRKLLLNKKELKKLHINVKQSGLTIIPTRIFINERGLIKLEIAIAKGKKDYDKRYDIKLKDIQREIDRNI